MRLEIAGARPAWSFAFVLAGLLLLTGCTGAQQSAQRFLLDQPEVIVVDDFTVAANDSLAGKMFVDAVAEGLVAEIAALGLPAARSGPPVSLRVVHIEGAFETARAETGDASALPGPDGARYDLILRLRLEGMARIPGRPDRGNRLSKRLRVDVTGGEQPVAPDLLPAAALLGEGNPLAEPDPERLRAGGLRTAKAAANALLPFFVAQGWLR